MKNLKLFNSFVKKCNIYYDKKIVKKLHFQFFLTNEFVIWIYTVEARIAVVRLDLKYAMLRNYN